MLEPRRLAVLKVSRELLLHVLGLPLDTAIDAACVFVEDDTVALRLSRPEWPDVPFGKALPLVQAKIGKEAGKPVFLGWEMCTGEGCSVPPEFMPELYFFQRTADDVQPGEEVEGKPCLP